MKLIALFCSLFAVSLAQDDPSGFPISASPSPTVPEPAGWSDASNAYYKRSQHDLDNGYEHEDHENDLSKRWKIGGYVKKDKYGSSWGGHISHKFRNGLSVKGTLDHTPRHGTSLGLGFEHEFHRRLADVEAAVQEIQKRSHWHDDDWDVGSYFNKGHHGPEFGARVSKKTKDGFNVKGYFDKYHGGKKLGLSAGKTWHHSDGSKTSVSGHYGHDTYGGPSTGFAISHDFGHHG